MSHGADDAALLAGLEEVRCANDALYACLFGERHVMLDRVLLGLTEMRNPALADAAAPLFAQSSNPGDSRVLLPWIEDVAAADDGLRDVKHFLFLVALIIEPAVRAHFAACAHDRAHFERWMDAVRDLYAQVQRGAAPPPAFVRQAAGAAGGRFEVADSVLSAPGRCAPLARPDDALLELYLDTPVTFVWRARRAYALCAGPRSLYWPPELQRGAPLAWHRALLAHCQRRGVRYAVGVAEMAVRARAAGAPSLPPPPHDDGA